ncbi:MAG: translation initiation factor [Chitinophagia bacterium]|jgi:translation initiation factor 1
MSKNKNSNSPLVYSTDPDFRINEEGEQVKTLSPEEQVLRVTLETKHRAGKTVTLVMGFIGSEEDREDLGKKLKNSCGTGGSAKDGEIILQGDHREKVKAWLLKNKYKVK